MLIFKYVVLLTVFLVGCGIYIDRYVKIKKKYNIKEEKGLLYKHVNKIHKWSEIVILIIMAYIGYLIAFVYPIPFEFYYVLGSIAVFSVLRAFMEWKYEKASNRYRLNILNSGFYLFLFVFSLGLSLFWF